MLKLALVIALLTGVISILGRPWAFRTSYELGPGPQPSST